MRPLKQACSYRSPRWARAELPGGIAARVMLVVVRGSAGPGRTLRHDCARWAYPTHLTLTLKGGNTINEPRVNEKIRISPIRLIDADGEQVGVVSLDKARQMATEAELDMVEVAPNARPPVVKLMDFGRYRYQQQKKEKEARKNAQTVDVKEVQLRPRTEDHDFQVKLKRARRFLEKGNVVKVVVRFRGRELRRPEVGHETMDRMLESMEDIGTVEFRSRSIEGRRLVARMEPA